MNERSAPGTLFLDIGGVLMTNGWDRQARGRAVAEFGLDAAVFEERHHQLIRPLEAGKIDLDEYLARAIFHRDRPFSREALKEFVFAQPRPYPEMFDLMRRLKARHGLKVAAVSNEGRALTLHRIEKGGLAKLIDTFVSSCFVGVSKPDEAIYRMALDLTRSSPRETVYVDDRPLFVEVARDLGICGIVHRGYESTRAALEEIGLSPA